MRALTAAQQAVWDSGNQAEFVRVSIKDGGGTFRDLTTYPGFNAVKSVTWAEEVDGPHMTCDFTLARELSRISLAPFVETSPINRAFDPTAGAVPLLAMNREVLLEVAIVPMDRQPVSGDWTEFFRGRVDSIAPTADIRVGCRGLAGRLAQQYIKTEYVYSYAAVAGVSVPLRIWEPQMAVLLNSYMLPASRGTEDPGFNKFLKCSQAGTTGTTEPVWTTAANQTDGSAKWDYVAAPTTSGNPVEQVMQNIMTDHKAASDPTVTLYTPSSPSWAIRQFIQQRQFVLDAVQALAKQIGWDVRYKWRSGTGQFEFTFYAPDRASVTTQFTFTTADYEDPSKLAQDISQIRNAWRLVYSDAGDLWPDGQPKRKIIEVSDATSITKYGELWAEIQEDSASGIDSVTEATTLVNAALSDCKEPTVELSVPLTRGFPWVELNDRDAFKANNLHFTQDQTLAVTGWSHTFESGKLKTTLNTRGQPSIGTTTWLERSVHPQVIPTQAPPRYQHFNGTQTQTLAVTQTVGGLAIGATAAQDKARIQSDELEIHISTTPGFTPSAGTLRGVLQGSSPVIVISDLVPGKTHYAKSVPRSHSHNKSIRGQPSVEKSLPAGRAKAGHYDSTCTQSHLPLNGNFEHALDDLASFPFDHWNVITRPTETTEAWGSGGSVFWATAATTKGNYVVLRASATQRGNLVSDAFEVRRAIRAMNLYLSIRRQGSSAASGKDLIVDIIGYSDAALTNVIVNNSITLSGDSAGPFPALNTWYDVSRSITAALGAFGTAVNFLTIGLRRGTTGDNSFSWEIGDVYTQESDFFNLQADTATIGQSPWTAPSYVSGWADLGSGFQTGGYFKDSQGGVHVRGVVRRSTGTSTTIFTLPAGMWPLGTELLPCNVDGAWGDLRIDASGNVIVNGLAAGTHNVGFHVTFDTR